MPAGRYTLYFMLVDCLDCDEFYSVADIIVHPGNSKLLKEIMAALLKQHEKEMADFESLKKNASGLSIRHQAPVRPTENVLIEKAKSSLSNGKSRHFNKSWEARALPGNRAWLGKYWKILRKESFEPESYPWEIHAIETPWKRILPDCWKARVKPRQTDNKLIPWALFVVSLVIFSSVNFEHSSEHIYISHTEPAGFSRFLKAEYISHTEPASLSSSLKSDKDKKHRTALPDQDPAYQAVWNGGKPRPYGDIDIAYHAIINLPTSP